MINFDLSLPDDDEWMDNLETEDDYKDRDEYDRTMTPPSPSLLALEEDNEDREFISPPAKKRKQKNPFIDEEDDDSGEFLEARTFFCSRFSQCYEFFLTKINKFHT